MDGKRFRYIFFAIHNEASVLQRLFATIRQLREDQRFIDLMTTIRDRLLKLRQFLIHVVKSRRFQYSVGIRVGVVVLGGYWGWPWGVYP